MKLIACTLLVASSSVADPVTLTMDEAPTQLIDGLSVSKGGERFAFSNSARSLFYNSGGPGNVTFVRDPSIQGAGSVFGVAFSIPVASIQFGMARLFFASLAPIATVSLYNGSNTPFSVLGFNSSFVDPYSEGQFTYVGTPVTNIIIAPNPAGGALAFDNLTVATIPEPNSLFSIGLAGCALGLFIQRKHSTRDRA